MLSRSLALGPRLPLSLLNSAGTPLLWDALQAFSALPYSTNSASSVIEVTNDDHFNKTLKEVADGNKLAIVDFTAKWCGPCRMIAPIYDQLSVENPQVKFLKVDIDSDAVQGTVLSHNITSVPTFLVYKGAERVESFSGAHRDKLQQAVQKYKNDK